MSRSKIEEQLKKNERYPFRSLTSDERQRFEHEEDLAEKREKAAQKRREEKKAEREEEETKEAEKKQEKTEAQKKFEVAPKDKEK